MTTNDAGHIIRIASRRDAALLSQLGARAFREAFGRYIPPMDLHSYISATYSPARQMDELANSSMKYFIAELEGLAVGYAMLHAYEAIPIVTGENPVELKRIYLLHDFTGRGLGAALMCKCMEASRLCAHKSMWLQVWERNERAIAFYRKWGFECVGEISKELGKSVGRDLIMSGKL